MNHSCKWCDNSGIVYTANGQDDFDIEYCSHCPEGMRAEAANVGTVLSSFGKVQESVNKLTDIISEPNPSWFLKI